MPGPRFCATFKTACGTRVETGLLVIAGPNGAGKTTVTVRLREDHGLLRKIYGELPQWVADATQPLERHPDFVDARAA